MPITTLNRTIALLLVGGAGVLLALIPLKDEVIKLATELNPIGGGTAAVVFGFGYLAASAFLGLLLDGLADLTVYKVIKRATQSDILNKVFRTGPIYGDLTRWAELAQNRLRQRTDLTPLLAASNLATGSNTAPSVRSIAAGLFLENASEEHVEWLTSYYGAYVLAGCFAMLAIVVTALTLVWGGGYNGMTRLGIVIASLAVFYVFMSVAIDRYIYAYVIVCRYTALHLDVNAASEAAP